MAYEHESVGGPGGVARDGHALKQRIGVALKDTLVVVGPRVALLAVTEDILGRPRRADEEAPLHTRREGGATPAPEPGVGNLLDHVGRLHLEEGLVQAHVPSVGYVLVYVGRRGIPGIAQGYAVLDAHNRHGVEVGNTLHRGAADMAQGHLRWDLVFHQVSLNERGNIGGLYVLEKHPGFSGLEDVHQGLGETQPEASHLLQVGLDLPGFQLCLQRLDRFGRPRCMAAACRPHPYPGPVAGDKLPPPLVGLCFQLAECRHRYSSLYGIRMGRGVAGEDVKWRATWCMWLMRRRR